MPIARPRTASARGAARTSSKRTDIYRRSFVRHVHELIGMAYLRMTPSALKSAEEPDITGQLVASIKDVLNDRIGPSWRHHFCVRDDPPVGRKGGKSRPRVDIEFER